MSQLERNVIRSFQGVKRDMLEVKDHLLKLAETQEKLQVLLVEMNKKTSAKPKAKVITKVVKSKPKVITKVKTVRAKTAKKTYVASKEGEKFHIPACPYAKNIKPKLAVKFKTKNTALNKGYKPCSCAVK